MTPCASRFAVQIATTDDDLRDACRVRMAGYGHHLGEVGASFGQVDHLDVADDVAVLICRDTDTGEPVGTVRIQTHERHPLQVERCVILPHQITSAARAEATRLAVLPGADASVKLHLMKAVYDYCEAHAIEWLVICARSQSLARTYRMLGFQDYLAPGQMVPLTYAGNIPHLVFTMNLPQTRQVWEQAGHRLQQFMLAPSRLVSAPAQEQSAGLPAVAVQVA
ncbi:hypothetical protein [Aquabacterium sp.]|uniref:hypothetical protein n=1 Tax=Aquabacterium sp. TaxID=1872578 RepID=UPI002E3363BD|nr:hypothetical protein [Aquabacterium sp.]HEX5310616.1 hypothetical protein [Aquabacterium sp.]